MAERPDAYFRKNPGDVIQSNEWNELQVKAREEIRAHRHTGNEDGSLIPRAGIEVGAIDGKLIDPTAEINVRTLTTSGNLTVKGELAVNGKALLGDIADLLATVKGLQDDKLNRRGDTVSGSLRVQRNLLVDGAIGVGTDNPVYTLDVSGSVRLGGFSEADTDEWPRVIWCRRADGTGWDEGLIKHSSARGFFGRSGIGMHIHESRDWGVWSSGWNPLLGIEGGTGNTKIKGGLQIGNSDLYFTGVDHAHSAYGNETGYAAIENCSNYGALMILGRNVGTRSAVNRVVKLWDYLEVNGKLAVTDNVGIGTTAPTHRLHVVAADAVGLFESSGDSAYLRLATKEGVDKRVEIIHRPGGRLSLWNNGEDVFNITRDGNVGIGTITPRQKLTVHGLHNASRDPDSGLLYGGQLAIKGNACQLDFVIPNQAAWAIHVNSLNKMHFVRTPWNASDLVLDGSGKIGIGTDSPAQQLTITGGLGFANHNAGDKKLHSPKDGLLEWMTNDAAGDPGFAVSHQGQARVYLSTDGNSYLNGGNVGIGTTTPSRTLQIGPDVDGLGFELAQRASPSVGVLRFGDNTGWKLHFGRSRELPNGELNSGLAGVLMTIKDNGDIGIGTTAPHQKLVVEGGHNSGRDPDSALLYGGQLAIKSNACQIDFIDTDPGHDDWAIMVNGSKMHFIKEPWTYTNMVLAANGNVGIGTDSPAQQLTITGGIGFANQNAGDKKLYSPKDGLLEWMTNDAAGDHAFAVSHQGQARVYLSTNGNSYLNGGNVGMGTTAPREKLEVSGNLNVSGEIIRKISMATALGPDEQTDNGPIASRVLSFVKRYAETAIRIIYSDNFRVNGNNVAARWEIRIDGSIPPGGAIYQDKYGSSGNYHEPGVVMGYARGIAAGAHVIGVWVSTPPGYVVCDAYTGWGSSRWTLEAQEVWL